MTTEKDSCPAVTVIMPAFNSARTLRESAQSVLDQSVESLELIVIDDLSTDDTAAVARDLAARDGRVRLIARNERGGPAAARNTGMAAARGRFIAFCDADDLWLPTKLERQLELAEASGASLIFSSYRRVDPDFSGPVAESAVPQRVVQAPTHVTYAELLRRNVIGCLTAVVDTKQTGPVSMPDVPGAEDWGLWLRILREGGRAAGVAEPLALYRTAQPGSHSAGRWRALRAVWRVLRAEERLSWPSAVLHLITDAASALRKSRV